MRSISQTKEQRAAAIQRIWEMSFRSDEAIVSKMLLSGWWLIKESPDKAHETVWVHTGGIVLW